MDSSFHGIGPIDPVSPTDCTEKPNDGFQRQRLNSVDQRGQPFLALQPRCHSRNPSANPAGPHEHFDGLGRPSHAIASVMFGISLLLTLSQQAFAGDYVYLRCKISGETVTHQAVRELWSEQLDFTEVGQLLRDVETFSPAAEAEMTA